MNPEGPPQADLFVRPDTFGAGDQQRDTLGRLNELADGDVLSDVRTTMWGSRIRLDAPETPDESRAFERYESLQRWAEREGRTLEPFFEEWSRYSAVLDEEYEELVTPVMCVVLTDDTGSVETVAPHRDGDDVYTVPDLLADLEAASEGSTEDDATREEDEAPLYA